MKKVSTQYDTNLIKNAKPQNSPGSFSRVKRLRSGSMPRPSFKTIEFRVDVVRASEWVPVGVKAVAAVRRRKERRRRIMVLLRV